MTCSIHTWVFFCSFFAAPDYTENAILSNCPLYVQLTYAVCLMIKSYMSIFKCFLIPFTLMGMPVKHAICAFSRLKNFSPSILLLSCPWPAQDIKLNWYICKNACNMSEYHPGEGPSIWPEICSSYGWMQACRPFSKKKKKWAYENRTPVWKGCKLSLSFSLMNIFQVHQTKRQGLTVLFLKIVS